MMHAARVEKSPRLQRVVAALRAAGPGGITSRDLARQADVVAPATYVSELRRNGFTFSVTRERVTSTGARVFRYVMNDERRGT
jgi:helix-turn-helix protein